MPPFAAQYATNRGRATCPPIELMLMIRPDFWGIITRPAAWQHRKTPQVDGDDLVPLGFGHRLGGLVVRRYSGTVDEDVETSKCCDSALYQTVDVRNLADICRHRKALASGRSDRAGNSLRRFRIPPIDRHGSARARHPLRNGAPDPPAAASHNGDFPRQRKLLKSVHEISQYGVLAANDANYTKWAHQKDSSSAHVV